MPTPHDPRQNHLLTALPESERARLLPHLELVPMPLGGTVCEPGIQMHHVYFPTTAIVSLLYVMEDGASAEIAVVGNEGMLGVSLLLGVNVAPLYALVQGPGPALRMDAAVFHRELDRSPALHRVLKRYIYVVLGQLAQTAACTRFHVVAGATRPLAVDDSGSGALGRVPCHP